MILQFHSYSWNFDFVHFFEGWIIISAACQYFIQNDTFSNDRVSKLGSWKHLY